MMIKRAVFEGSDEPQLRVITPGSGIKTAGCPDAMQAFISTLVPDPAYTYVHCIAMGRSEFYGANSNTDWYGYNPHLNIDGLMHTWDDFGSDIERDRMRGKTWGYGYPCFYNAAAYAHHKNTDPVQLGFGDVVFVWHNDPMKRIELVIRVFNAEARAKGHDGILQRIRNGSRCDVSMGTKIPWDACSVCTDWDTMRRAMATFDPVRHATPGIAVLEHHRKVAPIRGLAVTQQEYCSCMRNSKGKILGNGQKVFVYNDFVRFFDISFVWVGADKTARVMWHLAPDSSPVEKQFRPAPVAALGMMKSAAMVKEVPGGIAAAVHSDAATAPEIDLGSAGKDPRKVLSAAAALGMIATPHEFQKLVTRCCTGTVPCSSFDTSRGTTDYSFAVGPDCDDSTLHALAPFLTLRSVFAPFLGPRISTAKTASSAVPLPLPPRQGGELDKLAGQYRGYRVSVLEHAADLFPKVAAQLDPEIFLGEKRSGLGIGGLLLGLAPVLSLLSSHFSSEDKNLGAMASFISDHPTLQSLATIGSGLRAALAFRDGSLGSAAGLLLPGAVDGTDVFRGSSAPPQTTRL